MAIKRFPVWLLSRLISAGLEPVLSHNEKNMYCIVLQTIFTNIKMQMIKLMPVLLTQHLGENITVFYFVLKLGRNNFNVHCYIPVFYANDIFFFRNLISVPNTSLPICQISSVIGHLVRKYFASKLSSILKQQLFDLKISMYNKKYLHKIRLKIEKSCIARVLN